MDESIREGFICSICRRELDSIESLQSHFETAHSSEDKAGLKAVKDLFGRAKRKILGDSAPAAESSAPAEAESAARLRSSSGTSGIDPVLWEPQEFGMFTRVWSLLTDQSAKISTSDFGWRLILHNNPAVL